MEVEKLLVELEKRINSPKIEEVLESELKRVEEKVDTLESNLTTKIDDVLKIAEETKKEKGDKGDSYVLTQEDKNDIAKSIKVPVVDRVIEKTEVVREIPIVTENKFETIKEVALKDTGEELVNKINELPVEADFQIDAKHIKNLPKAGNAYIAGGITRSVADSLYAPIGSTGDSGISESLAIAYAVAL